MSGLPVRRAPALAGMIGSRARSIPVIGCAAAAAVVIVGLALRTVHGGLGTATPPFVMVWRPDWDLLALVSAGVLAGAATLAPRALDRAWPTPIFAGGLYLLALALGLSLNIARAGFHDWSAVFDLGHGGSYEAHFEYLGGLGALAQGADYFIRHFGSLFYYLPTHARGNPPGPLVALRLLGIDSSTGLAALCIGIGALSAPLAYDLGRVIGGETRGRLAGVLTAFAPSMLLFGVTSADYAFAALGLCVACLLVRRHPAALTAGAVMVGVVSFFSWLLLAIPAWAAVLALRRDGARRAVWIIVASAMGLLAVDGLLALTLGYDPFSALRATSHAYHLGIAVTRPYEFWIFGSPTAWAVMLGLPVLWFLLRSLATGESAAVALAALIVAASLLGLTKAETERIWLPFVPLACVAAAATLPRSRLGLVLWLLVAQALAIELLFFTIW